MDIMGKERSMNLKQLTYFVALAKNQNFTTAANELFICQSALSKTIKAMEEDWMYSSLTGLRNAFV